MTLYSLLYYPLSFFSQGIHNRPVTHCAAKIQRHGFRHHPRFRSHSCSGQPSICPCQFVVIFERAIYIGAHVLPGIFTEAMWGFNKTDTNRPQDPLIDLPFSEWWFVSRSPRSFQNESEHYSNAPVARSSGLPTPPRGHRAVACRR